MNRVLPRILLADGSPRNLSSFRRQFENAGFPVRALATAADVIISCELDPPDVLILDLHLPDMDGFEICTYVRRETRDYDVTIIVMADVSDDLTRAYLGQMVEYAGADYFVAKPCDGKLLLELVDILVHRLREENDRSVAEACAGAA